MSGGKHMLKHISVAILLVLALAMVSVGPRSTAATQTTYDTNTLAGKAASVQAAQNQGLQIGLSGFILQEADTSDLATNPTPNDPITPSFVLSSNLDGQTVQAPDVTVNQDTAAATQNEPVIAVDSSNPNRIVAASNDYVTRTWSCTIGTTPCSRLGDGYSGTYFSNDGGMTWCCVATDPQHIGTLIPGIEHLVGGQYDAGGDPNLAFDNRGNVYYTGLGFDRLTSPNTVAVNKGTFDSNGNLHWGSPVFIGQTTSPSTFNDKSWTAVDTHASSHFQGRVYVSWTRFIFNPTTGAYVQSPIIFAYSTDGGQTFSDPQLIAGNVLYSQGSHVMVGPDGTVYVLWDGNTRFGPFDSTWMVKSTDGGVTFTKPLAISPLVDIFRPVNTAFRVNSFPAGDVAPNGGVYVAWSSEVLNTANSYGVDLTCTSGATVYASCHAAVYWSKSTDNGATWTNPQLAFPAIDASTRTPIGYPVTQPGQDGAVLDAPAPQPVDTFFPAVAISPRGNVYMSAYAADVVSPWQRCAQPATPTAVGRINCLQLDNYIHNARLDYVVTDLTTAVTQTVTTQPINTRYQFGGGFIGDYTDLAVGSDNNFHAIWTDTNNQQSVIWWYGFQFVPTSVHQQDVVTYTASF
jgi:hypothetical protein